MEKQVVIETMELMGMREIVFGKEFPHVKLTPHSPYRWIDSISIVARDAVMVSLDGEMHSYDVLPVHIKQTIGQRLRFLYSSGFQITNEKKFE